MSDRPERNPQNAFRTVSDEGGLVVNPIAHDVSVLNPVGSFIYARLDGSHTVDQLVAAVVDEYDVAEADARRDVTAFLDDLEKRGMLSGRQAEAG